MLTRPQPACPHPAYISYTELPCDPSSCPGMLTAQMSPREGNCTGARNHSSHLDREVQCPQRLEEEGADAAWALGTFLLAPRLLTPPRELT